MPQGQPREITVRDFTDAFLDKIEGPQADPGATALFDQIAAGVPKDQKIKRDFLARELYRLKPELAQQFKLTDLPSETTTAAPPVATGGAAEKAFAGFRTAGEQTSKLAGPLTGSLAAGTTGAYDVTVEKIGEIGRKLGFKKEHVPQVRALAQVLRAVPEAIEFLYSPAGAATAAVGPMLGRLAPFVFSAAMTPQALQSYSAAQKDPSAENVGKAIKDISFAMAPAAAGAAAELPRLRGAFEIPKMPETRIAPERSLPEPSAVPQLTGEAPPGPKLLPAPTGGPLPLGAEVLDPIAKGSALPRQQIDALGRMPLEDLQSAARLAQRHVEVLEKRFGGETPPFPEEVEVKIGKTTRKERGALSVDARKMINEARDRAYVIDQILQVRQGEAGVGYTSAQGGPPVRPMPGQVPKPPIRPIEQPAYPREGQGLLFPAAPERRPFVAGRLGPAPPAPPAPPETPPPPTAFAGSFGPRPPAGWRPPGTAPVAEPPLLPGGQPLGPSEIALKYGLPERELQDAAKLPDEVLSNAVKAMVDHLQSLPEAERAAQLPTVRNRLEAYQELLQRQRRAPETPPAAKPKAASTKKAKAAVPAASETAPPPSPAAAQARVIPTPKVPQRPKPKAEAAKRYLQSPGMVTAGGKTLTFDVDATHEVAAAMRGKTREQVLADGAIFFRGSNLRVHTLATPKPKNLRAAFQKAADGALSRGQDSVNVELANGSTLQYPAQELLDAQGEWSSIRPTKLNRATRASPGDALVTSETPAPPVAMSTRSGFEVGWWAETPQGTAVILSQPGRPRGATEPVVTVELLETGQSIEVPVSKLQKMRPPREMSK